MAIMSAKFYEEAHNSLVSILEVGHPGIWSRDINILGMVLGIYLHFLWKIRFFNLMSRTY